ncbi:MAG: ABC transporter permease [Phycisphaerales bacterium]
MDEGRLPTHTGEIAIDPMTAKALNAKLGDTLDVQRFGDPIALKVVGILQRPMLGALQRPYVVVARADLVEATGSSGLTTIMARLKPGTDVRAWVQEHKGQFKDPLVLEPSERITTGLDSQERATKLGFALVSVIAFMSAAFIVGTGMTTAVAEQQRQLAVADCWACRWACWRPLAFARTSMSCCRMGCSSVGLASCWRWQAAWRPAWAARCGQRGRLRASRRWPRSRRTQCAPRLRGGVAGAGGRRVPGGSAAASGVAARVDAQVGVCGRWHSAPPPAGSCWQCRCCGWWPRAGGAAGCAPAAAPGLPQGALAQGPLAWASPLVR